jgi:glucan phosphoethanolaminetransferase (alkaline phosphatase superfamily)
MFDIVSGLIPAAIGVALSPAALIELILVLFSKRARVNGLVFVGTLMVSIFAVAAVGAFAMKVTTDDSTDQPSTVKGIVLLLLGGFALAIAWRNWTRRADTSVPKVFDAIANMGPGAVFVLAVGAVPLNPKNLVMVLAAGAQAAASGEPTATVVTALVVFTLLAASPFLVAIGYVLIAGDGAQERLGVVRDWLMGHNRLIMAIVLGVLGVVIVGQGWAAVAG